MVKLTRQNVTFYIHGLSCYLSMYEVFVFLFSVIQISVKIIRNWNIKYAVILCFFVCSTFPSIQYVVNFYITLFFHTLSKHTHTYTHPHITNLTHVTKTPKHYKTHTYEHPHIKKPTHRHIKKLIHTHTHILKNPHIHTPTHYKPHTCYQNTQTLQNSHI